jgi:hypothetical protein
MAAFGPEGGKLAITLYPLETVPDNVEIFRVAASSVYDEENKSTLEDIVKLWQVLVNEGKVKPNPVKVRCYMRLGA